MSSKADPETESLRLGATHRQVLLALADGCTLKAHRYVDGAKVFRLHPLDGPAETVSAVVVDYLFERRLIDSNKKFPAATYWLTEDGKKIVAHLRQARATAPTM